MAVKNQEFIKEQETNGLFNKIAGIKIPILSDLFTYNKYFVLEESHKSITKKFKKRKVHSSFIENTWGADLADMQLISKFNKGFFFLLCTIDIYSKYAGVIPLKDKKRITITYAFQRVSNESNRKKTPTKYG